MRTRICSGCGECLAVDQFARDPRRPDAVRARCRPCHTAQKRASEARVKERVREEMRLEAEARALALARTVLTPPRTYVGTGVYVPVDRGYYRNDGHKAVPSREAWT